MHRRTLLAAALAGAALPRTGHADPVDLTWDDLLPADARFAAPMREIGIVTHDDLETGFVQPEAEGVTTEWNGRRVRLPGFVTPLELDASGVTAFILVPYYGACIHVPPPPANQLVLVTARRPWPLRDPMRPVTATGVIETVGTSTGLADIGYAMEGAEVRRYRG